MAVQTISSPLKAALDARNLVTIAAAGTPTANFITIVVPDATTNADIAQALWLAYNAVIGDPVRFRAH